MNEVRSSARPRWRALLAFGLGAVTLSATTSYCWNRAEAKGDTSSAREAAQSGDSTVRHQAIKVLFEESVDNIEALQLIVAKGAEREAQQASYALEHLRRRLR